jgi:uncharacterized protein (UPF0548 family)
MGFSYTEVGASRDTPLPAGYRHLDYHTTVGHGTAAFQRAGDLLMSFDLHRRAGIRVRTSAAVLAPGVRVDARLGVGPIGVDAPCQIVWVVDDTAARGFGYGTLAGHPVRGEESFLVSRADDGRVDFAVRAFSRPARWFVRLAGPLGPAFQRGYAVHLGRTLRRLT